MTFRRISTAINFHWLSRQIETTRLLLHLISKEHQHTSVIPVNWQIIMNPSPPSYDFSQMLMLDIEWGNFFSDMVLTPERRARRLRRLLGSKDLLIRSSAPCSKLTSASPQSFLLVGSEGSPYSRTTIQAFTSGNTLTHPCSINRLP